MKLILQILVFVFCLSISLSILGQENNLTVTQINKIKKSGNYIYAEVTMPEQKQAKDGAMTLLKVNIDNWLNASNLSQRDFDASFIDDCIKEINTKRSNQYRVFLYINKSNLVGKKEEKKTDISIKKDNTPDTTDVQVADFTECTVIEASINIDEKLRHYQLNDVEEEMVIIKKFDEIKSFVEKLKVKGHLKRYGKYATLPKIGKFYMLVYSKTGDVVACLLKTDNEYYNLREQTPDSINNYKKCGSIWLEIIK